MPGDIILLYIHVYTYILYTFYIHILLYIHSWYIRCDRQKFSSFWAIFCPFSPLTTWKTKLFTLKKTRGDLIILYICTINDNPEMSSASDNFLSFWTVFVLLPSYGPRKSKFWKKWNKHHKILSFYKCVP